MNTIMTFIGTLIISLSAFSQKSDATSTIDWETPEASRSIKIYAEYNSSAIKIINAVTSDIVKGKIQFLNLETGDAFVCISASNKAALAEIKAKLNRLSDRISESACR